MHTSEIISPDPQLLAINNPGDGLADHLPAIKDARIFWKDQLQRAQNEVNVALENVALGLYAQLTEGLKMWSGAGEYNDSHFETGRKIALGTLAVAILLQQDWGDSASPQDALGRQRSPQTIMDFGGPGNFGQIDFRIHTIPADPGAPKLDQWHFREPLYIRQVRPAEPTPSLKAVMENHPKITADFTALETLYPYVAR